MGFRAIERSTGVNHNSVINWVKQVAQQLPDAPEDSEIPAIAQVDELESFVGSKKTRRGTRLRVVGSSQGTKSWDSQLGVRGPFCRNLLAPVVGSPLLEVFSLHYGRLLCLPLLH